MVERLAGALPEVSALPANDPRASYLHPRSRAQLTLAGKQLGVFGALHPDTVDAFDLGGPALVIEIDLTELEALPAPLAKFRPIPRLPAVTRDIALEVPNGVPAAEVGRIIAEAGGELCESVALFDLFEGGSVKAGHRSLAFHVVYRDPKAAKDPDNARTLTDAEVDQCHERVVRTAGERFGASLRA
jgi:phenylalanyl-tRNA synthetase beta chain